MPNLAANIVGISSTKTADSAIHYPLDTQSIHPLLRFCPQLKRAAIMRFSEIVHGFSTHKSAFDPSEIPISHYGRHCWWRR